MRFGSAVRDAKPRLTPAHSRRRSPLSSAGTCLPPCSKTTPGQIAAQLAVGAAALGLFYNSFYRKPEAKPSLAGEPTPAASSAAGASAAATLVALDAEAANTAGKVWAAKQKQADAESEARARR